MAYASENALYQWQDGERRVREADEPERARLERASEIVLDELRRRLGSRFAVDELAAYYGQSTDWAEELASRYVPGSDAVAVVDAAFGRYARESSNFAGGRRREANPRDD
jgi:hypothetical protein